MASGTVLNGKITRVEDKKVYGLHQGPCGRCGGQGGSSHWPGFTCFKCGGSGTKTSDVRLYSPDEVLAIAEAKGRVATQKREASEAKASACREAASELAAEFKADRPDLFRKLEDYALRERDPFVDDLMRKLDSYGSLSDAQVAVLGRAIERRRAADADAANSDWRWMRGERVEATVTLRHSFDTSFTLYGRTTHSENHVGADDTGNVIVFKVRGSLGASKGDRLTLKGSVKEHGEYKGTKQTRLERVKVLAHVRKSDLEAMVSPRADVMEEDEPRGPRP